MSNNHDDFEDDDIEPAWATPDDAEDDWDDGAEDDGDFGDDDFAAHADDAGDDEDFAEDDYGDDFEDDGGAEAYEAAGDDEYDDGYGDEDYGDEDYGDEDDEAYEAAGDDDDYDEDEDGDAGDDAASADSPLKKYMPYAMMGGFGLFVLFMGYTMFTGGGNAPAPQPQPQPLPIQTAQNTPQPSPTAVVDPAVPGSLPVGNGNVPFPIASTEPPNDTVADLANLANPKTPPQPQSVQAQPPVPPPALGANLPGAGTATPIGQPTAGSKPNPLAGIGTPIPINGPPVTLGGSQVPVSAPSPNLSGPLGLSTGINRQTADIGTPDNAKAPVMPEGVGRQPSAAMVMAENAVTKEQLKEMATGLKNDIASGIKSLRQDLLTSVRDDVKGDMAILRTQIADLQRNIKGISSRQQALTQQLQDVHGSLAQTADQLEKIAKSPAPAVPKAASGKSDHEAAPKIASSAKDAAMQLQDRMEQAISSVKHGGMPDGMTKAGKASVSADTAKVMVDKGGKTSHAAMAMADNTSRPPVIRRSAAPKSPPPVPAAKPGMFMAQHGYEQPGAYGARMPVQMAQAHEVPGGVYALRGVSAGTAWVSAQDTGTVLTVNRGDYLPGLGRVTEIRRSFNGWEVVSERGIIRQ